MAEPLTSDELEIMRKIGRRRGLVHGRLTIEGIFKDGELQEASVLSADRIIIRSQNKRKACNL